MKVSEFKKKYFVLQSEARSWAKDQKEKSIDVVKWDVKREPQSTERPWKATLYKEV